MKPDKPWLLYVTYRKRRKPYRHECGKGDCAARGNDKVDYAVKRRDKVQYAAREHDEADETDRR